MKSIPDGVAIIERAGVRALEQQLLEDLCRDLDAARADLSLLARPVLVVVSSGTLRRQLAARIAKELGPAALGVAVSTLFTLAREILERAGKPVGTADALFGVLARREAMKEESLAAVLGTLRQGPGLATSAIRDLLSAGLGADLERDPRGLLLPHPDPDERRRALSLVAAARRTAQVMEGQGILRAGDLLHHAAAVLRVGGADVFPCRGIRVHGFADATGQSAELLAVLLETYRGSLYLDVPPDPARPDTPDPGAVFVRRFAERLLGWAPGGDPPVADAPPTIRTFSASGADAEVREVAYRVRETLDAGARPEGIALVARNLPRYAASLRRHFTSLGIPFSGGDAPPGFHPESRRLSAALEVLETGSRVATDRWLDALRPDYVRGPLEDLRLGLRALGAARLADVTRLDPEAILGGRKTFSLPARRGFARRPSADEPEGDEDVERLDSPVVERRKLSAKFLGWSIDRARALTECWNSRPTRGSLADHAKFLTNFFGKELGWNVGLRADQEECGLDSQAADLLRELPALATSDLILKADEIPLVLRSALQVHAALGGRGAGVQLLDSAHARGCTFEHLFVLGLNRDLFPRNPTEDPLLPDSVRRLLAAQLPHLHAKGDARHEERYLFASLVAASPQVTLSWQRADEDGREKSPSPFLVRLQIETGLAEEDEPTVPREQEKVLSPPWTGGKARPRGARDAARLAGFTHKRSELAPFISLAAQEVAGLYGKGDEFIIGSSVEAAEDLARVRLAVLDEWAPDRRTKEGNRRALEPGPYLGLIGGLLAGLDSRRGSLFITRLEAMARCPWQTFLRSMLRIEPVPDPFGALPSLDMLVLGNTVHQTLERIFEKGVGRDTDSLSAALELGPVSVARPGREEWQAVLEETAATVARNEGIHLRGMHQALVQMALPYVDRALQQLYPGAARDLAVIGSELEGEVTIGGGAAPFAVRFRADQVTIEGNTVVLTDFKTGKPISKAVREATRADHLLKQVREGLRLQAAAYALCQVPAGQDTEGRYLFVRPGLDDQIAVASVRLDDRDLFDAFQDSAHALRAGLDAGIFFPRLENAEGAEPAACKWCELTDACGRQDSGVRGRLAGIAAGAKQREAEGKPVKPTQAQLARLWFLGTEVE